MIKCNNCLLPENFPKAKIDESGNCIYCRKGIGLSDYSHEESRFIKLIQKKKDSHDTSYDCVVSYSGGKDSTYTLIQTKEKYGLKPLVFTLDNGFISTKAKENITIICDHLNVDLITIKPNVKQMKAVFKTTLSQPVFSESVMARLSAACYACITFINYQAIQIAIEKGIQIIISGFTHGQVPKAVWPYNSDMLVKTYNEMKEKLSEKAGFDVNEFYPKIDFTKIDKDRSLYNVNPLLFEKYNENQIIDSIQKYGWERPLDVDSCSSNCLMNKVGNYYHDRLYGYHPYQYEVSALIRIGSISKDEGQRMLSNLQLDEDVRQIVNDLGMKE